MMVWWSQSHSGHSPRTAPQMIIFWSYKITYLQILTENGGDIKICSSMPISTNHK